MSELNSSAALQTALNNISGRDYYNSIFETITQPGLQNALKTANFNASQGIVSTLEALRNAGLWTPQAQDSYEEGFSEEQGFEDDDEAAMVDDDEDDNSQDESLDD